MKRQSISIKKYDWELIIFHWARHSDVPCVLNELFLCGASADALDMARGNVGGLNNGLTYTNACMNVSVMVLSEASGVDEYADTFVHELNHVCSHIESVYDIDPHGEEASYLMGDVAKSVVNGMIRV